VHLNPVRAGLLRPEQPLENFSWSSYPLYIGSPALRPGWLRVDRLMGEWRIDWTQPEAGQHFAASMEARRQGELEEEFKPLQRGWCLGSEAFRAQMLEYADRQRGKWHYGAELWESAQAKAEQLIAVALKAEAVREQHLANWHKSHPFKVALACRLRKETTVTVEWLAQRLKIGSRGYLAHLLKHPPEAESPNQPLLPM